MKELSVVICDDEEILLPQLKSAIGTLFLSAGLETSVEAFSASRSIIERVCQGKRDDVYFLDIDIPDLDGISLGERILRVWPDALICFISAREDLVFETFRIRPLAFVRKSSFREDIKRAIHSIVHHLAIDTDEYLEVADELGHGQRLNLCRLLYIEAEEKYQKLVFLTEEQLIRSSSAAMEKALSGHGFVRIHRSYLVNLRFLYRIGNGEVILDSRQALPMSRHRKKAVQESFLAWSAYQK